MTVAAGASPRHRGAVFRAPVDVVTGFLGSGKTTLIRRLLGAPSGRRVAVLVNELAGLDVDGRTLEGIAGVGRAVELEGGCICCEVSAARLGRAVESLLDRVRPDLVVLETSGAAEPGPAVERLREAGLTLDAVIAVVDAERAGDALDLPVGRAQVAAADIVLVNRVDLAAPGTEAGLDARLARLNPRAARLRAVRAGIDVDLLFATGVGRLARREETAGPAAAPHGFEARTLCPAGRFDRGRLIAALAALPACAWRAKGIVRVADGELALLVNAVRGRVEAEWLPFPATASRLVVIGPGLAAGWPEVAGRLAACAAADARSAGALG